jgi:peptide/nickel transport system permease protein
MAPVAALAMAPIGILARTTRAQLLEVLGHDYVRCARAKGLSELAVLVRHALPNAMVPIWVVVGTLAGAVLTATAVVETVFNLPGLGRLAIFAVLARDYPLAGAVILAFVLAQVTISLAVDLLIVAIDPRSRKPLDGPGR